MSNLLTTQEASERLGVSARRVIALIEAGRFKPVVHSVFPAMDASHASGSGGAQAHALMESSQHVGKIVLNWEAV